MLLGTMFCNSRSMTALFCVTASMIVIAAGLIAIECGFCVTASHSHGDIMHLGIMQLLRKTLCGTCNPRV